MQMNKDLQVHSGRGRSYMRQIARPSDAHKWKAKDLRHLCGHRLSAAGAPKSKPWTASSADPWIHKATTGRMQSQQISSGIWDQKFSWRASTCWTLFKKPSTNGLTFSKLLLALRHYDPQLHCMHPLSTSNSYTKAPLPCESHSPLPRPAMISKRPYSPIGEPAVEVLLQNAEPSHSSSVDMQPEHKMKQNIAVTR